MTTPWTPSGEWHGATVAIFGSGQNLTPDVCEELRSHFCIAVNFACRAAPWADMLVALDGNWPQELREFAGLRMTGVADPDLDALYVGPLYERVRLSPSHEIEIRNSGLAAIRIAARMGASRIILAGFEPERPRHFYDDEVDTGEEYVGLSAGIAQITAEMAARGVVVERHVPAEVDAPVKGKGK